jgi:hypothetical protein
MWYFISRYKNYSTQVMVDGVKVTVNFRELGKYPTTFENAGVFQTNDEALASALRAHPKYAGDYELLTPGKDFTGTDEDPVSSFAGDEYPLNPPFKSGDIYTTDDLVFSDITLLKPNDLLFVNNVFCQKINGVFARLHSDHSVPILSLKAPAGTIGTQVIYLTPGEDNRTHYYVYALILENDTSGDFSNIKISSNGWVFQEVSISGLETKVFQFTEQSLQPIDELREIYCSIEREGLTGSATFILHLI